MFTITNGIACANARCTERSEGGSPYDRLIIRGVHLLMAQVPLQLAQ